MKTPFSIMDMALRYLLLAAGAFIMLLPFLWMVNASLMTTGEIQKQPPVWFPAEPQWSNYSRLGEVMNLPLLYGNSIFVTTTTTIGVLFTSSLAGFAFAKYQFRGRDTLFMAILATMMIPSFVTLIPTFYIVKNLGWINSYQGLIIPGIVSAYGIFLMRQFISSLPDELLDAARIDGASEPRIYFSVILPLISPALATLGTFTFIGVWNAFLFPMLITFDRNLQTLPLGLNALRIFAAEARNLDLLMAGTTLSVLPSLLLFIVLQRYFIQGIALTGLKG
jgi:multiple sugar transport system permease protein